jgi:phage minor structural protein
VQQVITTYRCEIVFDSISKTISIYEKYGEDRGAYFIERLNLKRLQVQSNSYDFATRLIPVGKDDLMLNIDGKNYIENYQYSKKVKTMTWKDERYTDVDSLKEDAEAKLDEISKPYKSYTADVVNLAEQSEEYKEVFSIGLGDTVLLISKSTGIRESHRIVKFYQYPQTREKNKVELANTRLSFEEVQKTEQELS